MTTLDEAYWSNRYRENATGWDLGEVSPPIKEYIDGLSDKNIKILVPGAGNAYEWKYLIERGFLKSQVVDIAQLPLTGLRAAYPSQQANLLHQDFFTLKGQYDLIVEQTFFCALSPGLRPSYVAQAASLLKDDGLLVGLLFNRAFDKEGPPFGGDIAEYEELFSSDFDILIMEECRNSVSARQGHELFVLLQKKKVGSQP